MFFQTIRSVELYLCDTIVIMLSHEHKHKHKHEDVSTISLKEQPNRVSMLLNNMSSFVVYQLVLYHNTIIGLAAQLRQDMKIRCE